MDVSMMSSIFKKITSLPQLPVYLRHSHKFHEWCRGVRVGLYEELFLMCKICLNHSSRYKHNKIEKCHEKQRHQKAAFSECR